MKRVKWTFILLLLVLVGGFLHYTLPQHDIVRITQTYSRRIDIGENSLFWSRAEVGMANSQGRDVFFIAAKDAKGKDYIYRNEDTGWSWPPYFKIDSFGLQNRAEDLVSKPEAPIWVSVTHYGWRNNLFTIFPNAVAVKRVDGPNVFIIPWVPIIFFIGLIFAAIMLRKMWMQFRERMVDPAMVRAERAWDGVEAKADAAKSGAKGFFGRISAWLDTWKSKKR